MDSWFDLIRVPPTRYELHYGSRIVRCFVDRPEGVHAMLAGAVARRPEGVALICAEQSVTYRELDRLVGRAAAGLAARGIGQGVLSAFAPDATTRCGQRSRPMRPAGL